MAKQKSQSIFDRLQPFASTDNMRENLNHVCVEDERAWATDGHRLHVIPIALGSVVPGCYLHGARVADPPQMPDIDLVIPKREDQTNSVTLTASQVECLLALGAMIKPSKARDAKLVCDGHGIRVALVNTHVVTISETSCAEIACNFWYLIDALTDLVGDYVRQELVLRFADALSPITITTKRAMSLIMPVRV